MSQWVRSLWTTEKGANFGGLELVEIMKDNIFELRDLNAARLWMLPPAAMEVAMELLCEDRLAHPQWPHVFVIPRFDYSYMAEGADEERGLVVHCPS